MSWVAHDNCMHEKYFQKPQTLIQIIVLMLSYCKRVSKRIIEFRRGGTKLHRGEKKKDLFCFVMLRGSV